jgi:hypothetical protein
MKNLSVLLLLALAACRPTGDRAAADRASGAQTVDVSDVPGSAGLARSGGDPVAKGAENVVIPANVIAPVQPEETNVPTVTGPVPTSLPKTIPSQFRGRWGLTAADCTSTRGDNKGLLVIGDQGLTFYEARGTLDRTIAAPAADRFEGSFRFSGEGMTWVRVERFEVELDSLRRRTDQTPGGEPPVDLRYTRCLG